MVLFVRPLMFALHAATYYFAVHCTVELNERQRPALLVCGGSIVYCVYCMVVVCVMCITYVGFDIRYKLSYGWCSTTLLVPAP